MGSEGASFSLLCFLNNAEGVLSSRSPSSLRSSATTFALLRTRVEEGSTMFSRERSSIRE
jgi:hypothetical protein